MHHSKRAILSGIFAALLLWLPATLMAKPVNDTFDHFTTGFPLTGGHRAVECDACHTAGQFRGTPRECASCHNLLTNTGAVVKSSAHIQASNDCETCHSTLAWDDVRRVNHMAVMGDCKSCHTVGGAATSRPPSDSIHTGVVSRGTDCVTCHRTSTWASVHFNHGANASGHAFCKDCHFSSPSNGGIAATPPPSNTLHNASPIQAGSINCDICHNTHSWGFSHGSTTGDCISCHDSSTFAGVSAVKQRPTDTLHAPYVGIQCNSCHSTRAWTPATFRHGAGSQYPTGHKNISSCSECHNGGYDDAHTYTNSAAYPNTCVGCHYSDFRREHSDSRLPAYANCLVGCHEHSFRDW